MTLKERDSKTGTQSRGPNYSFELNGIFPSFSKLQLNQMCGTKNYPYLPHRRDFSLPPTPHHHTGNSSHSSYIYLNLWAFETPHPPGISNPFCGGNMGIFWNYTIIITKKPVKHPQTSHFSRQEQFSWTQTGTTVLGAR